jgi:hypothetical protein
VPALGVRQRQPPEEARQVAALPWPDDHVPVSGDDAPRKQSRVRALLGCDAVVSCTESTTPPSYGQQKGFLTPVIHLCLPTDTFAYLRYSRYSNISQNCSIDSGLAGMSLL